MTDATKILQKCLKSFSSSSRPTWYIRARKLSYVSQVLFQIKISRINNLHGQFVRWVSRLRHTPLTGNSSAIHNKHLFLPHDDLYVRTRGIWFVSLYLSSRNCQYFALGCVKELYETAAGAVMYTRSCCSCPRYKRGGGGGTAARWFMPLPDLASCLGLDVLLWGWVSFNSRNAAKESLTFILCSKRAENYTATVCNFSKQLISMVLNVLGLEVVLQSLREGSLHDCEEQWVS